jgi:hypothetical protein
MYLYLPVLAKQASSSWLIGALLRKLNAAIETIRQGHETLVVDGGSVGAIRTLWPGS